MEKMELRRMSDAELKDRVERLIRDERKVTAALIEHLAEVQRRRLFSDWGFSSLFDYLRRGMAYSESAAYRRVEAARALIQIPELKEKIEEGTLKISQIALVQSTLKQEHKNNGPVSIEEKRELFEQLSNKTAIETQKILDYKFDLPETKIGERHRHDDSVELTVRLPKEVYAKLTRVKEVYSNIVYDGNWVDLLDKMSEDCLNKRDWMRKKTRDVKAKAPELVSGQSRVNVVH